MKKAVAVLGTYDTKYDDFMYLAKEIRGLGVDTLCIDVGAHEGSRDSVDISSGEVAAMAGAEIGAVSRAARKDAIAAMAKGARACVGELYRARRIDGIVSMGGGGALELMKAAVDGLPTGFPKVFASTFGGSSMITELTGGSDILVMNSLVDISGVNCITRLIYRQLAGAVAGAVQNAVRSGSTGKRRIAATMYGMTTPGVNSAKRYLEERGYEVVVFHANITGGNLMEKFIGEGFFDGVLDLTLTELNTLALSGDPEHCGVRGDRMEGAARRGIPFVACPGAVDMTDIRGVLPKNYNGRTMYCHNDPSQPTHYRPSVEDARVTGKMIAEKLNRFRSGCALFLPRHGLSLLDIPGGAMYSPEADAALFEVIRENVDNSFVELIEVDGNINEDTVARNIASKMDELMKAYGAEQ